MTFEEDLYSDFPKSKDAYVRFKNRILKAQAEANVDSKKANPGGEPDISPLVFRLLMQHKMTGSLSQTTLGAHHAIFSKSDGTAPRETKNDATKPINSEIESPIVDLFQACSDLHYDKSV